MVVKRPLAHSMPFMIALTLSPSCRSNALTLTFVMEATTAVPPANLISTSLFTAPCSSLATTVWLRNARDSQMC
jgi:hypothetical protein